jgi:hypothetical protein
MYETIQRVSIVLEQQDEDKKWITVAILIDERGQRQRTTLDRFATRGEAAASLESIYRSLPRRKKPAG